VSEPVLQAERLTRRFGRLTAVAELSLEVREGEVFGLLGPNGAGKTTTIRMLCGLLRPDEGRVLVHGRPLGADGAEVRTRVGICPQQIVVWKDLGCLEQLVYVGRLYGLARRAAEERGRALLAELGLEARAGDLARTLSGGMQRRLNIALALVHDPPIVVLDEPEAGLDPQSRVLVRDFLRRQARRRTILLTTHNMDEAERVADRVAIIDRGRLLTVDTPEALRGRVGPGDVLELSFAAADEAAPARARELAAPLVDDAVLRGGALVLRAQAMARRLAAVLEALERAGASPVEVRLRPNTLEDVFISLTGRGLRE
jgi:ABC-2 type transport system ATP-binding protein